MNSNLAHKNTEKVGLDTSKSHPWQQPKPTVVTHKQLFPDFFPAIVSDGVCDDSAPVIFALEKFESVKATVGQGNLLFAITQDVEEKFAAFDPYCKEKSTAEAVWSILEKYVKLFFVITQANRDEHNELFQVVYNSTQKVYRLVRLMKQFWQSPKLQELLIIALKALESCPLLLRPKYLEWKLKLDFGGVTRNR